MPIAKSEFIRRISLGNLFAVREGRTVTKWTVVAVCGLLAVCAEIGEAAARGMSILTFGAIGSQPPSEPELA